MLYFTRKQVSPYLDFQSYMCCLPVAADVSEEACLHKTVTWPTCSFSVLAITSSLFQSYVVSSGATSCLPPCPVSYPLIAPIKCILFCFQMTASYPGPSMVSCVFPCQAWIALEATLRSHIVMALSLLFS